MYRFYPNFTDFRVKQQKTTSPYTLYRRPSAAGQRHTVPPGNRGESTYKSLPSYTKLSVTAVLRCLIVLSTSISLLASPCGHLVMDHSHPTIAREREIWFITSIQPLGQRSTYDTIIADRGSPYVATFQCLIFFLPVYNPLILQSLVLLYFTCMTPNNDWKVEQLFCSMFLLVV